MECSVKGAYPSVRRPGVAAAKKITRPADFLPGDRFAAQFAEQPRAGERPRPVGRPVGHPEQVGGLFEGEPGEVVELDQFGRGRRRVRRVGREPRPRPARLRPEPQGPAGRRASRPAARPRRASGGPSAGPIRRGCAASPRPRPRRSARGRCSAGPRRAADTPRARVPWPEASAPVAPLRGAPRRARRNSSYTSGSSSAAACRSPAAAASRSRVTSDMRGECNGSRPRNHTKTRVSGHASHGADTDRLYDVSFPAVRSIGSRIARSSLQYAPPSIRNVTTGHRCSPLGNLQLFIERIYNRARQ